MFAKIIKKYHKRVIIISVFTAILALLASLIPVLQYRSTAKFLIVQKHDSNVDSYTAIRSSERIASLLSDVVYTSSFMNQVLMIIPEDQNSAIFSQDKRKARKSWKKNIDVDVALGSNMFEVSVYDKLPGQANEIVNAISYILINRGVNYHGSENVIVKQVDSPLNSHFPVRPNIPINVGLAFAIGLVLSTGFFYYQELKEAEQTQNNSVLADDQIGEINKIESEENVQDCEFAGSENF